MTNESANKWGKVYLKFWKNLEVLFYRNLNLKVLKCQFYFEKHCSLLVQSSFSQNELVLPLRKDISRRIQAFDLKFVGLLGLTGYIVMNESICHSILRNEFLKINVSQFRLCNLRGLSEFRVFKFAKSIF